MFGKKNSNLRFKIFSGLFIFAILATAGILWLNRGQLLSSAATVTPSPGVRNGLGFTPVHDISTNGWTPTPTVPIGQYYTLLDEAGTGNRTDYITSAAGTNNAEFLFNPNTFGAGPIDSITVGFSAKPRPLPLSTSSPSVSPSSPPPANTTITVNINPSGSGWQTPQTLTISGDWRGYLARFTGKWTMDQIMTLQVSLKASGSVMIDTLGANASYFETNFSPEKQITRATMADAVGRAWQVSYQPAVDFKDVPPNYWAYPYIEGLFQKGWIKGYGDGTFRPEQTATRAEVAVLISRAAVVAPYDNPTPSFTDVPKTYWAYKEIEGLKRAGMVSGYGDGTFRPDNKATRADLAVFVYRGKKITIKPTIAEFLDVPINYWAFKEITWIAYLNNFMRPEPAPSSPSPTPRPSPTSTSSPTATPTDKIMLYLNPSSGTYAVGQTFDVAIRVNPTNHGIVGVDVTSLHYPTDALDVVSITPGQFYSKIIPNPPVAQNGVITFSTLYNTYPSGWGFTVATVKFKVKSQILPSPPTYKQASVWFNFTPGSTTDCNVSVTGYPGQDRLETVVNAMYTLVK